VKWASTPDPKHGDTRTVSKFCWVPFRADMGIHAAHPYWLWMERVWVTQVFCRPWRSDYWKTVDCHLGAYSPEAT